MASPSRRPGLVGRPLVMSQHTIISGRRFAWSTRNPLFSASERSARSRSAAAQTWPATRRTRITAP